MSTYINGQKVNDAAISSRNGVVDSSTKLFIGRKNADAGGYFNGAVDDFVCTIQFSKTLRSESYITRIGLET